ncbi:MAG: MoaD/ThiS family protein [Pseudomonadota bacterium]
MLSVHIRYFASLREDAGCDAETVATDAATPVELFAEARERHAFTLTQTACKVAINDAFASWSTPLGDGDRVVFLPPVAGG